MARGENCTDPAAGGLASALRAPKKTKAPADPAKQKAKQERIKRRVEQAQRQLEAELKRITNDDQLKEYLRLASRFHGYSARNNLILRAQKPDATIVYSQSKWASLGRTIKQGTKPIRILAPRAFIRRENPATGEDDVIPVGYGTVSVYDVSDTEGTTPPPTPPPDPIPLTGNSPEADALVKSCTQWCVRNGIKTKAEDLRASKSLPTQEVLYDEATKTIFVESSLARDQRAYVLCSTVAELAVDRLDERHLKHLNARERALTNAACAYAIASGAGLDARQVSFPQLAAVATDTRQLERCLEAAHRAAAKVLGE